MFSNNEYQATLEDMLAWLKHLQDRANSEFFSKETASSIGSDVKAHLYLEKLTATQQEIKNIELKIASLTAAKPSELKQQISSTALFTQRLPSPIALEQKNSGKTFTAAELKLIEDHYEKIPAHLKQLIDVVLIDEQITFDKIKNPVFIIGEGEVYDYSTAKDLIGKPYPNRNRDGELVSDKNIIPCYTILDTMQLLLEIIKNQGQELDEPVLIKKSLEKSYPVKQRITPKTIEFIEENYKKMSNNHKSLFNLLCRDRETGKIMQDPVLLPDGYVYDRSTALYFLEENNARSPSNNKITFTKNDITQCNFIDRVLEALKDSMPKLTMTPPRVNALKI